MVNEYGTIIPDVVGFDDRDWWPKGFRVVGPVYHYRDDTGEMLRWVLEETGGQWLIDELDKLEPEEKTASE